MAVIPPVVRHMLLCDDVTRNPDNPEKVSLIGLTSVVRAVEDFPILVSQLCVYLVFTNGRGSATIQIVIREAETGRKVTGGHPHRVKFAGDPTRVQGLILRLRDCVFPEPGLYQVELHVDEKAVAEEPLLVR
jgi:hypothetical protein